MKHRITRRVVGAMTVAALVASSCGSDDDESSPATDSVTDDADTDATDATDATDDGDTDTTDGDDSTDTTDDAPSDSGSDAPEFECPEADRGGDLDIATFITTNTVSPYALFGTGAVGGDYAGAIFDTIWRYDAPTETYSPRIGETLTNDDGEGTVWTLTLRDGVTFGNGNPYTTADVKAHIEALQQTALRAAGMTQLVESIEIVDDLTMTLTLSAPFNMEYFFSVEPGWVPDSSSVAAAPEVDGTSQFGIDLDTTIGSGAGPFEIETVDPGERIVLRAKDSYWGGRACVDTLTFRNIPEEEALIDSFDLGEVDVMFVSSNRVGAEAEEIGELWAPGVSGALDYAAPDQGITGNGETKWNDIRLREALQLAVDYDTLNERAFDGLAPLSSSALVPEESALWTGVEGPPYDPDRAGELVAEAAGEGIDTSFTYLYEAPDERIAITLEAMWEAVGFDVTLEVVTSTLGRIIEKNFDVSTSGYGTMPPAPWTTLNGLQCDNVRQRTGFCDEEMDAALDRLRGALDLEETKAVLEEVQEIWNRTFPVVIVRHSLWGSAKQDWVGEIQLGPDATPYFHRVTTTQ